MSSSDRVSQSDRCGGTHASRRHLAWLVAAVLLGIALRGVALAVRWDAPLTGESLDYLADARALLDDPGGWIPRRPVGLPLAMAAVVRAAGTDGSMVRLIPFAFGLGTLVAAAMLAWRCSPRRAAVAAFLVAVAPSLILDSTEPLSEMPVAFVATVVTLLLVGGEARGTVSSGRGLAVGLVAAAGALFRTTAGALVALPWAMARRPGSGRRGAAAAALVFALIIGAVIARNTMVAGRLAPLNTLDSKNLFYGNNRYTPLYKTWVQANRPEKATGTAEERAYLAGPADPDDPVQSSSNYAQAAVREILADPGRFVLRTVNRTRCWFAFDTNAGAMLLRVDGAPKAVAYTIILFEAGLWMIACLLALSFVILGLRRAHVEGWRGGSIAALGIILLALPYTVSFAHPTYHLPAWPLIACLAALGAQAFAERRAETGRHRRALIAGAAVFLYVQVEWVLMMIDRL